jgi:KaiC/GvpD/RAD55 family RecA-like ATPase
MKLHLIEDLTTDHVPVGSNILVEFDASSQWYAASISIAAEWLKQGGKILYGTLAQQPEKIRSQLKRQGVDVELVERDEKLKIWDWYTATLGQKSKEKYSIDSLKVHDLSLGFLQVEMRAPVSPDLLRFFDNVSVEARFNEEKSFVEFLLARAIPVAPLRQTTTIRGMMKGVHSESAYRQLEGASDGVIDIAVEEKEEEVRSRMGLRVMRNAHFSSRWHALKVSENFEITLDK